MGLDMWLYCNSRLVCESANDGADDEESENAQNNIAVYWREARLIHEWFVENVQGGNDDCGLYEVRAEELMRLREECMDALEEIEGGFVEYDEWKWWDLQFTANKVEQVTKDLVPFGWIGAAHKDEPDWRVRFYYESSW